MHGNDGGRGHPIAKIAEVLGGDDVVGADDRTACLVVADARQAQTGRRIDDREIGAKLVEALVKQARHHGRGAVERILGLPAPECRLGDAPSLALGQRHAQRVARGLHRGQETVSGPVTAHLSHTLAEDGVEFDPVAIPVDHRMAQAGTDLVRGRMSCGAHVVSSRPMVSGLFWPLD